MASERERHLRIVADRSTVRRPLQDLRGTHETLLLDDGVGVHVVAARGGQDPAVLLRSYAKRTKKADVSAANAIRLLTKGVLG